MVELHIQHKDASLPYPAVELRTFDGKALMAAGLYPPPESVMPAEQVKFEFEDQADASRLGESSLLFGRRAWSVHAGIGEEGEMKLVGFAGLSQPVVGTRFWNRDDTFSSIYILSPE